MKVNQDTPFTKDTIVGSGGVLYALANKTETTDEDGRVSYEADLIKIDKIEDAEDAIRDFKTQYLRDTDWYVVRFAETGEAIPEDIKLKRQEGRELI